MGARFVAFDRALNWIAFGQLSGPADESTCELVEFNDGSGFAILGFDYNGDYEAGDTLGRLDLAMELLLGAIEAGKVSLFGDPKHQEDLGTERLWQKLSGEFVRRADFDEDAIDRVLTDGEREFGHLFVGFDELSDLFSFLRSDRNAAKERVGANDDQPDSVPSASFVSASTIADETNCAALIEQMGREHVGAPLTKQAVWKDCQRRFPRLSYRAFGRCWATRTPVSWRKPGRRPTMSSPSGSESQR